MTKLTFKVQAQQKNSVISLISEINNLSGRIYIDLENNFLSIKIPDDSLIEHVIELVDSYYTITNIEITTEKSPNENESMNYIKNKYLNTLMKNLARSINWTLYNTNATEQDLGKFITTCMCEMSMKYSKKPTIDFAIGDIVDVNYGTHLPGEVCGGHIHSIVCHVFNNLAYVIPITKADSNFISESYLPLKTPQDATYVDPLYNGGTALIDKGRYVRIERFNYVIGRTTPTYFNTIINMLSNTFNFKNEKILY